MKKVVSTISIGNFYEYNYSALYEMENTSIKDELLKIYEYDMKEIFFEYPDEMDYNFSLLEAYYQIKLYKSLDLLNISKYIFLVMLLCFTQLLKK